jgi:hypothetical protein
MAKDFEVAFMEAIEAEAERMMEASREAGKTVAKYTAKLLRENELIVTEPRVERYLGRIYESFLEDVDLPSDKVYMQHFDLLMRAMVIYVEREKTRGSLWAAFDEHDSIHHMRSKLARIIQMAENGTAHSHEIIADGKTGVDLFMDEILDLVNYAIFCLRHILGWKPQVDRSV